MDPAASPRRAHPAAARVSDWRAADGWPLRRFDWPAGPPAGGTPRGAILFQGGRGDFAEKYLEAFAHWHARGWTVTSVDWRGQGGSGRLGADPRVGHVADLAPLAADLAAFWRAWDVPGPRVAIGHSMGGHLILRALAQGAIDPAAAVLVAPMLGLNAPCGSAALAGRAATLMARAGDPARAAWRDHELPGGPASRQALLTHDAARYADEAWWWRADPRLRLGPPSWGWVAAAFRSTRALRRDTRLGTMTVPTLALIADADRLVDARAAAALVGRLPDHALLRFGPEAAHELLREADPVRDRALAAIDGFLDQRAPRA